MIMKFRKRDRLPVLSNKSFDNMIAYCIILAGLFANTLGLIGALTEKIAHPNAEISIILTTVSGIVLLIFLLIRLHLKKIKHVDTLFFLALSFFGYALFPNLLIKVPRGLFINYLLIIPITCGMCHKGKRKWTIINGIVNYFVFVVLIWILGEKGKIPTIDSRITSFKLILSFTASYSFALIITHILMGNLRRAYTFMEDISYTDELTGLPNRRRLDEKVEQKIFKNCVMLDIDLFKKVNDVYGHAVGDEALQTLSSIVSKYCSDEFKCYRYGGEEFAILSRLPINYTIELVVSIVQDVRQKFCIMGEKQTISAGIGKTLEEADKELYNAKEHGRNRIYYNGIQIMF